MTPSRCAALNGTILLVVVAHDVIAHSSPTPIASVRDVLGFVLYPLLPAVICASFYIFVAIGYQQLVFAMLSKVIRRPSIWLPVFLLPAAWVTAGIVRTESQQFAIQSILKDGRLANLPKDASENQGVFVGSASNWTIDVVRQLFGQVGIDRRRKDNDQSHGPVHVTSGSPRG